MPKQSQLPPDAALSPSDYVTGVQASGPTAKTFTLANLLSFFLNQDNIGAASASPVIRQSETMFDHIVPGGAVLSGTGYGSTLGWSLTAGVVYINGRRLTVAAATGTVTPSKDTYFDLLDPGTGTVATLVNTGANINTTNTASPALAANSVRLGIIAAGANIAAATSINQGQESIVLPTVSSVALSVQDSLGNLICPRDPTRKILGYREMTTTQGTATTSYTDITALSAMPIIVPSTRKVKLTLYLPLFNGAANGLVTSGALREGGSVIAEGSELTQVANNTSAPFTISRVITPTAGLHTYKGSFATTNGSFNANVGAFNASVAYLIAELA